MSAPTDTEREQGQNASRDGSETIAARATPAGTGGIGVVRISGPRVQGIARSMLGAVPPPRRAVLRPFRDSDGRLLDQGIALYFPGPQSFTGEDVLELHGHGGDIVLSGLVWRHRR